MEGLDKKSSTVRQLIIRVSDQLKAGEISLIEVTPEEAQAAKALGMDLIITDHHQPPETLKSC